MPLCMGGDITYDHIIKYFSKVRNVKCEGSLSYKATPSELQKVTEFYRFEF